MDVVDDQVTEVIIKTTGPASQEEVLTLLTAKFGKPKQIQRSQAQNLMGASFPSIHAIWTFSTGALVFEGVAGQVDVGQIAAMSNSVIAKQQEDDAKQPHL